MNSSKSQGMSILSRHRLPSGNAELVELERNIISCCSGDPAPEPSATTTSAASELLASADPEATLGLTGVAVATSVVFAAATNVVALDVSGDLLGPIRKESRVQG